MKTRSAQPAVRADVVVRSPAAVAAVAGAEVGSVHEPAMQRVAPAILDAVDKAVDAEWANALARAATISGRSTSDERRAWILSILVFGNAAAESLTRLAARSSWHLGLTNVVRLPVAATPGLNSSMGRAIIAKYARKRAAVGVGTALPFGIGAVVGATANYTGTGALARHAHKFFQKLPQVVA